MPEGWSGSFTIDRQTANLDRLINLIERSFATGGGSPWSTGGVLLSKGSSNPAPGTIYTYVRERDGSTTTFEFTGVTISLDDAGRFTSTEPVHQRLSFFASARNII